MTVFDSNTNLPSEELALRSTADSAQSRRLSAHLRRRSQNLFPRSPRLPDSEQRALRTDSITLTVTSPTLSTKPIGKFYLPPPSRPGKSVQDKPPPVVSEECVCDLGPEFIGDLHVSSLLPSKSKLKAVEDLPVYDANGRALAFGSLYKPEQGAAKAQKVMVIFIRHFLCGNCQEYLHALSIAITPSSLPPNTTIKIIGCGSHTLISSYIRISQCAFPIFADPSKQLYDQLGMIRTLSLGNKEPDYIRHSLAAGAFKSVFQGLKRIGNGDVLQAGDLKQVGGEFLFEFSPRLQSGQIRAPPKLNNRSYDGVAVTWCHRMRNTRDHTEVQELPKILGMENPDDKSRSPSEKSGSNKRNSTSITARPSKLRNR